MESLEGAHGGEHAEPTHIEHPPVIDEAHHTPAEAVHADVPPVEVHADRTHDHHVEEVLHREVAHTHKSDPQAALAAYKRSGHSPVDVVLGGAAMIGYGIARVGKPLVKGYVWVLDKVTTPIAEGIITLAKKATQVPPLSWIYNLGKGKGGQGHGGHGGGHGHDAHANAGAHH